MFELKSFENSVGEMFEEECSIVEVEVEVCCLLVISEIMMKSIFTILSVYRKLVNFIL